MSVLINRQDVVSEIHKYFFEEIDKTPWVRDEDGDKLYTDMSTINALLEHNKKLSKRIKALPFTESKTGWTPVSEGPPSDDGDYLVCMTWDSHKMDVLMWADGWNCIRLLNGEVDKSNEIDGTDILAWMPLPESYRDDYELATEQMKHDAMYELMYNFEDGSL